MNHFVVNLRHELPDGGSLSLKALLLFLKVLKSMLDQELLHLVLLSLLCTHLPLDIVQVLVIQDLELLSKSFCLCSNVPQ